MGKLNQHRQLEESGQGHRIVRAIKRRNEDGSVYDLAREWMNEALFYPFALKRDSIDASSRIYEHERHRAGAERGPDGGAAEFCGFVRVAFCGR